MEEKERKLTLHDISQALAGASDEELIEFAAVREHRVDGPYRSVVAWDYLSLERQRAILKEVPWIEVFLSPEQKERFAQGLDGIKYLDWSHQKSEPEPEQEPEPVEQRNEPDPAAEPKAEPAPEPTTKKAPWWMFWK